MVKSQLRNRHRSGSNEDCLLLISLSVIYLAAIFCDFAYDILLKNGDAADSAHKSWLVGYS